MGVVTFSYVYLNSLEVEFSLSLPSRRNESKFRARRSRTMLYRKREIRRGRKRGEGWFRRFSKKRRSVPSLLPFSPFFLQRTRVTRRSRLLIVIRSMRKNCIGGYTKWFAKGKDLLRVGGEGREGERGSSTHGYNGSRQSVIYDHGQFPSERIHLYFRPVCSFKLENRVNLERRGREGGREGDGWTVKRRHLNFHV